MSQDSRTLCKLRESWFQVGDEVTINRGSQKGIVLGFGKRHIGRNGYHCHKISGVYIDFGNILVANETGVEEYVDALGLMPPPALGSSIAAYVDILGAMSTLKIKIADLPDTPFWEGDHVIYTGQSHTSIHREFTIVKIRYNKKPIYYEVYYSERNMNLYAEDSGFQLVKRGNIWKLAHGEPLDFTDIGEEAKFYQSLGMSQRVKKPLNDDNLWNTTDALGAIVRGEGHQMKIKDRKNMLFALIKYDSEEFGERMRAYTLKQFGLEYDSTIPT
jgi:hypothetical protein